MEVLDCVEVAVPVLERRELDVPIGLDVGVLEEICVAVRAAEAEEVLLDEADLVPAPVGRMLFVVVVLGLAGRLAKAERVPVVVFVEVLERVVVEVGTMPVAPPKRAKRSSHLMYLFTEYLWQLRPTRGKGLNTKEQE